MVLDCCSVPIVGVAALSALCGAWLLLSVVPFAFMLGMRCYPCCDPCGGITKLSDPKDEGTWVPSGDWGGRESQSANFALPFSSRWVQWTFMPNPGDESGETWFFYGSQTTSKRGGASLAEQRDWTNLCNWYSAKSDSPSVNVSTSPFSFSARATRLPPDNAVVHIYTPVSTESLPGGTAVVKAAYFWQTSELLAGSTLQPTGQAHVSAAEAAVFTGYGVVFSGNSRNKGTIASPALFVSSTNFSTNSRNEGTIDGAARFLWESTNFPSGVVNGNAIFENESDNLGLIDGDAEFYGIDTTSSGVITGFASFSLNALHNDDGVIQGGATFSQSTNRGLVENGAEFDASVNRGTVNGGAVFKNSSLGSGKSRFSVETPGVVNGGATFDNSSNGSGPTFGSCSDQYRHIVNGGAVFFGTNTGLSNRPANQQCGVVNDGATFEDSSANDGTVNDGAAFVDLAQNTRTVNGGATFSNSAKNFGAFSAAVNDGAVFNDNSENQGTVNGSATFNDSSINTGSFTVVNGGATFNGSSRNTNQATVNGGAVFNDSACSTRTVGSFFATPCSRKFVAHPTDLPTCNGTAPNGCENNADTCGCG